MRGIGRPDSDLDGEAFMPAAGGERSRIRGIPTEGTEAARALRRRMTPAERYLWEAIRERRLAGLKFRRQYQVGPYVLDFYCPECKLAIELDGDIHDELREYDADRTAHLQEYGYQVLRFRNEDVLRNRAAVLERIERAANAATPPLPALGEGVGG